ncbi:MAG: cytochrome C oxidase subunit IV family protein [Pseudomonadota bacterium]|nr:cytochrome C oxidase subunit IV family protein [Pseudomonadota bacterium]
MSVNSDRRLAITCIALTGVTLLSWWLGASDAQHPIDLNAGVTFGVIAIAALKVRVIVWEFMELRHAPALLRRIADVYLAAIVSILLVLYLTGSRLQL